jgi:hypothetical protein
MIVVLALVLAITLVLVFLCLALWRPQQPSEDRPMCHNSDPPWLLRDTPKYVPPQEVAEQYYSHVRRLNEVDMRSWPSSASSFRGGISTNQQGKEQRSDSLDYSESVQTAQPDTIPAGGIGAEIRTADCGEGERETA